MIMKSFLRGYAVDALRKQNQADNSVILTQCVTGQRLHHDPPYQILVSV